MAKKLHIETLALHVGQETPDPATDSRVTRSTLLTVSASAMQVISMVA